MIDFPWDLERDLCSGYSVSIGNPKINRMFAVQKLLSVGQRRVAPITHRGRFFMPMV